MDEHTYTTRQPSALDSAMDLVRKSADSNLAYLDQLQEDLKQSHLLSERIQRMKRQDLALLTKRFHTALEKKIQTTTGMLGDFCTMAVLYEWAMNAKQDEQDEYLLCLDLLFEAHHDTFAWVNNLSEESHPAGGRLRANPVEGQHQDMNILTSSEAPEHLLVESSDSQGIDDPFLKGLSDVISEAEELAASNRRIEAIIELIETMSFTYGSDGKTFSGTFHARRLASTMRLHQMNPPSVEARSAWGIVGGVE